MTRTMILGAALLCTAQGVTQMTHATVPSSPAPSAPTADAQALAQAHATLLDWPNLARYRAENEALPTALATDRRVVFYGDSITDNWGRQDGAAPFFPGKPYLNRGISGQTTPQMLVRFQQDVVHLQPAAVLILAGTNDIAGNTGPSTPRMIEDNFTAMAAIANHAGIKVILASITPAFAYPWKPGVQPAAQIREVNQWLRDFCSTNGYVYLDYYTPMSDPTGAMLPGYAADGVHPTAKGYAVMAPLAEQAITKALTQ